MEYIKIGRVLSTRGLIGEVKIKSFTNMQDVRFKPGNTLFLLIDKTYKPMVISKHNVVKGNDILSFKDYEDINKIKQYLGTDIYAESSGELELNDNEYLVDFLIGAKVYQNKELKGQVKEVVTYPQGDYLVVLTENGDKLIPFRDEFILKQSEEEIEVVNMEGLFWK